MILDEHCPCGNGPQALAAAEKRGPIERTDYEAWFWSQAPTLESAPTGLMVERLPLERVRAAGELASHSLDGRHGR